MKKGIIFGSTAAVIIIIAGGYIYSMFNYGPGFSDVKDRLDPTIIMKPDTKAEGFAC
jgi:hypothetical protein